jgi:hypothetical protein
LQKELAKRETSYHRAGECLVATSTAAPQEPERVDFNADQRLFNRHRVSHRVAFRVVPTSDGGVCGGTLVAVTVSMQTISTVFAISKVVVPASVMAAALCTCFARSAEAREDRGDDKSNTVLAFDLDFIAPIRESGADIGAGGAVRLGRKIDLVLVSLTPEIGGGYDRFNGDNDARIYRGFIGARLGFGKVIEPSVFAHIGVGKLDANFGGHTAATVDAGIALDLTFLPLINLGAHASYNSLLSQNNYSSFDWLALGLHIALVF